MDKKRTQNLSSLDQHIRRLKAIYALGTPDAIRMAAHGINCVYESIEQDIFRDRAGRDRFRPELPIPRLAR